MTLFTHAEQNEMIERVCKVLEHVASSQFLLGVIFVAKHEDEDLFKKIQKIYLEVKNDTINTGLTVTSGKHFEELLKQIAHIDIDQVDVLTHIESSNIESITYCLQPLLAVKVLQKPNGDTNMYVNDLLMIQRLKNYSMSRLYSELIRACLISLYNVSGTTRESIWCAFTFIKVPHIIRQLYLTSKGKFYYW